jgi:hypothetical protein
MGFLDNSGDIILDAVLTDHGRKVLSKGDGSFQITKFALGDEEVDYSLYDTTNTNGSAYYDLEILQTPVLEAFTDNAVSMKSKLVTYESLDLLYLPIIKLNESNNSIKRHSTGAFIIAVDSLTEDDNGGGTTTVGIGFTGTGDSSLAVSGILFGQKTSQGGHIRLDQGLDTQAISPSVNLLEDQKESAYTIQIDNRLGSIVSTGGSGVSYDYIDDDSIAYYNVTSEDGLITDNNSTINSNGQTIKGPRGTILQFKIAASLNLNTSTYLFTQLGGESTLANRGGGTTTVYHIDTLIRITGINTGYTVDIPVRFVKYKSA